MSAREALRPLGHEVTIGPVRRLATTLLGLAGLSFGTAVADPPAPAPSPLTADEREFFAWWDRLGFPDVGRLPFVRVWTGSYSRTGDDDPVPATTQGFLVEEAGPRFRVFLTDLSEFQGTAKEVEGRPWDRVGIDRVDLETFVRAGLDGLEAQGPEIPWFEKSDPFGAHEYALPNHAFRIAVLARACAARGLDELAHRLCDRARFEQTRPTVTAQWGLDDSTDRAPFSAVKEAIRSEARHVFESGFGDEERTWADLLADAERYASAFAPDTLRDDGDGDVAVLRRIVAAEARRAASKPPEPRTEAEQVAAWVDGLHAVRLFVWSSWGIWERDAENGRPVQAHHRLEDSGFAAVPALIAALDDVRFTRVVRQQDTGKMQYRGEVDVLRVGDLAWLVLDRISGNALESSPVGGPPTSRQPTRRRAATEWFEDARRRGETTILAERVAAGGPNSSAAAERLARLDANAAVAAIEKAVASNEERDALNLVWVLGSIDGEVSTAALLRLRKALGGSPAGVQAASLLWRRGRREGLDELIRRWKAGDPAGAFGFGGLADALVETGHVDALGALADGLGSRPVADRMEVIEALVPPAHPVPARSTPPSPEWTRAAEELLGGRLEDAERVEGRFVGGYPNGWEPLVGEMALLALSRLSPKRWSFDPKAPAREREVARIAAANAWRAARGIAPLVPTRREPPPPLPLSSIRDLVDRALRSSTPEERKASLASIAAMGLPAVPALREAVAAAPGDAPGRADVDRLALRLSFTVSEVVLPPPEGLDPSVLDALSSTRGKVLSDALWWSVWRAFVVSPSPSGALELRAERDGPHAGVRLSATRSTDRSWVFNFTPGVTTRFPVIRQGDRRNVVQAASWTDTEDAAKNGILGSSGLDSEIERATWDEPFEAHGEIYVAR